MSGRVVVAARALDAAQARLEHAVHENKPPEQIQALTRAVRVANATYKAAVMGGHRWEDD